MFTEEDFIRWVSPSEPSGAIVGIGDDAAVFSDGLVVSVDSIVEGVHFDPGEDLDRVARKALGAALSDLCAMGAKARSVFVGVQIPDGCEGQFLAEGLRHWASEFAVELCGGDTVKGPCLALSVTAVGNCDATKCWRRSGAEIGDGLFVTGPLGGSRGRRHLDVQPRQDVVDVARIENLEIHAAIDLSDGLGRDLVRLCEASEVGAMIDVQSLPVHDDVAKGEGWLESVLGDGEDFELLFAMPEQSAEKSSIPLIRIGQVCEGDVISMVDGVEKLAWPDLGFIHAF